MLLPSACASCPLFTGYPCAIKKIGDIRLGIIGQNLFFLKRYAPFDPEQVAGVNPGGVGVDVFSLPAYRSIGFSLQYTL